MSWGSFRCAEHIGGGLDCAAFPESCIGERLYRSTADAMERGGYVAAGYTGLHVDDCWAADRRDPASHALRANLSRFPSGIGGAAGLVSYARSRSLSVGIYSDVGPATCGGYPGSWGHEAADASLFAGWGIAYLKQDGCHASPADLPRGYAAMGSALRRVGAPVIYSCSWAAYLGDNESAKPFDQMAAAGCHLWRNWRDVQCSWHSVGEIIEHWGTHTEALQAAAGPGRWNDPDMLLLGALDGKGDPCLNLPQQRTQLAIWALIAAPLLMGNDVRNVTAEARSILLNPRAIAVSQDAMGRPGGRLPIPSGLDAQVWARRLAGGDVAVGIYHRGKPFPPPIGPGPCAEWELAAGGFWQASYGGNLTRFTGLTVRQAQEACCADRQCAGFSFRRANTKLTADQSLRRANTKLAADQSLRSDAGDITGEGEFKADLARGFVRALGEEGFAKPSQLRMPAGPPARVVLELKRIGLSGPVRVVDIWTGAILGVFSGSVAATVNLHDTAFLRLSPLVSAVQWGPLPAAAAEA
jgi:alpha-N-acetylgalactosaminidase